ncbi:acyl-CoA/acyl-ACP dehydrogenase [Bradyrhizobium sp. U87765 SZCCT0131]|uniref:acyl-CoA dehydrogenase family protein n=1 Tax=unclassified Bradyrhizobium TaxID=2631580 RepID=UPI001BAB98D4|nr:acyl-CoA/acyl-ACP dehydrogenase [Bradyrhizobium sp. U87765 SZCCT0131]MBR1259086.1 acyl-CoA/acyl-ACP dehydrogenase [Bradyrhizobium sp. U87765 SZCCT0134]MBR1305227.1 acyl-CoA/acyl-ACP dehydrogenase [Bradyrhizobium sp. U87765 SZCCT0110]MBR1321013.1 acyl-CoA/acyl-ACP dehydrogenase [Bradyrhizobium sp. U87765 SZCCT0109]MBR1350333.1 acyl-CoA/acyl-ACP dehydrogenase [Bradyrhizobium sp. U87765 SZCCT0048]
MPEPENIVVDTATRIFNDLADAQSIIQARDARWTQPLWQALSDAGLTLAWVPENCGGSGADLADGFGVIQAAGRAALAVPLAETLIAGWLLAQAGLASPSGAMTVAPATPGDRIAIARDGTLSGRARRVPFARDSGHIAVLADGPAIALVATSACRVTEGENLAGEPSSTVVFDGAVAVARAAAPQGCDTARLLQMGAIVRSLQMAGALETALEITVRYANERVAFERPISKFQAVQHNLARLAGEVAAAVTAASSAADAFAHGASGDALLLEAAAAKIRCGEAAEAASAIAHQVHGAIGFTSEHILHRFTLRALGWRDDFGHESHWAVTLGQRVAALGADDLWPLVAAR